MGKYDSEYKPQIMNTHAWLDTLYDNMQAYNTHAQQLLGGLKVVYKNVWQYANDETVRNSSLNVDLTQYTANLDQLCRFVDIKVKKTQPTQQNMDLVYIYILTNK